MCVKQACSRTIQTSGADRFVRGAHHRRCAREGLTGFMMPYVRGKLQAQWARVVGKGDPNITGPGGTKCL